MYGIGGGGGSRFRQLNLAISAWSAPEGRWTEEEEKEDEEEKEEEEEDEGDGDEREEAFGGGTSNGNEEHVVNVRTRQYYNCQACTVGVYLAELKRVTLVL